MVIGITITLLGAIVHTVTQRTFSAYLREQSSAHSAMLPVVLAGHYTQNQSWDGAQPIIAKAADLIGAQVALVDAAGRVVAASDGEAGPRGIDLAVTGSGGERLGTVYIGRTHHQQQADAAFLAAISRSMVAAGLGVSLVAALIGWLMARSISRPLAEMNRAAGRMATGDYGVRVSEAGRHEIGALGRAFNQMAASMAGVEAMRRRLVGDVSHELRTPLTVIRGYLEGLRTGQIADRLSAERAFEAMHLELSRLLTLVEELRHLATLDGGLPTLRRQRVEARRLVDEAIRRVGPLAMEKGVRLAASLPPDLPPLAVDLDRMDQVLFNLLENAIRHTTAGGQITVGGGHEQGRLWLTVTDTGEGIGPEHLPHIFERFYRADPARTHRQGGGAGIGLAIVQAIVQAHGGAVRVASRPGAGACFTIDLPLADEGR